MRELIHELYEPVLRTNEIPPRARSTKSLKLGEGVIDDVTFRTIEVDRLFDAVNNSSTVVGQATLYRSLARPLNSADIIKAKQEALQELSSDNNLSTRLEELAQRASKHEKNFYTLLYGRFYGFLSSIFGEYVTDDYGYGPYRRGTKFMRDLAKTARSLPTPESAYLRALVEDIREFDSTRSHALMQGPVYLTFSGHRTKDEVGRFTPAIKFRPTLFKPRLISAEVGSAALLMYSGAGLGAVFLAMPATMAYAPMVGAFDRGNFIYPLRDYYRNADEVQNAFDSLGKIDELLSFHRYAKSFGSPTVLPKVVDVDEHYMVLKDVRNPILGKGNPKYVPNDLSLNGTRLAFITGPNSGGKTAFCKTVTQVQLLAQIGCYVPAEYAEMSTADRIFYQAPELNSLEEEEGRFGTELKRTKGIFFAATPRSLVVLDELSEGTTYEEKLETSYNILNGFHRIGNNTILITHNHQLAEHFQQNDIGQYLQVEFAEDAPTYRLVEGISTVSHADRVARKIGFAKEDIEAYLSSRGYVGE